MLSRLVKTMEAVVSMKEARNSSDRAGAMYPVVRQDLGWRVAKVTLRSSVHIILHKSSVLNYHFGYHVFHVPRTIVHPLSDISCMRQPALSWLVVASSYTMPTFADSVPSLMLKPPRLCWFRSRRFHGFLQSCLPHNFAPPSFLMPLSLTYPNATGFAIAMPGPNMGNGGFLSVGVKKTGWHFAGSNGMKALL